MVRLTSVLLGGLTAIAGVKAIPTPADDADAPFSTPSLFDFDDFEEVGNVTKRVIMSPRLPNKATGDEHKFQPFMDL